MAQNPISRRSFMQSGAALPLALTLDSSGEITMPGTPDPKQEVEELQRVVKLSGDGQSMTPREYAHFLSQILSREEVEADYYSNGGVVEALEGRMAQLLGKERAVFLPTGTLANHLAVRIQAGERSQVIVQKESHIYNDSGDCAQILSNLNLLPLAPSGGTFTLDEVQAAIHRADGGRVRTGVGVISIESPIRRLLGKLFDYEEMKRICAFARAEGIATHMDGARLFMASGYTGISPEEYASLFDTVYVSMWKYFDAPSGAILAGPRALLDDLFHTRRMFGGGLPYAWPLAAALHSIEGFEVRFRAGVAAGEELKPALNGIRGLRVEEIPDGSNVFKLHMDQGDPAALRAGLREKGVLLPAPSDNFNGFALGVNETLVRRPVEETVRAFSDVLEG
ncbi:MAG: beta-eliminating lyase-related protein [Gemmatimonadota bacterium]